MSIREQEGKQKAGAENAELCFRKFSREGNALRIELETGKMWLLPYVHFLHASLETGGETEVLHIAFSSHDIFVRGRNLAEVMGEFQFLHVELLKEIPARYQALSEHAVRIESIQVCIPESGRDLTEPAEAGSVE